MARFMEILRCNGVDQDATPHPAMVVPVNVQEFDYELTTNLLRGVRDELSKPGTDPLQRDASCHP